MPDAGNPNFFTTFKGRYTATPASGVTAGSNVVMLSCVNDVIFCGNYQVQSCTQGQTLLTLPVECRPVDSIILPISVYGDATEVVSASISTAGTISLDLTYPKPLKVFFKGWSFNISPNFY